MKTRTRLMAVLAALMLAAFSASVALAAGASDSVSTSASVTILDPVSISERQPLDFGRIIRPPSVKEVVNLFVDGSTTGTTATLVDGQQLGSYAVTGDASATILIGFTFGACSDAGTNWVFLQKSPGNITGGSGLVTVGGSIGLEPTAASGSCAYKVNVNY